METRDVGILVFGALALIALYQVIHRIEKPFFLFFPTFILTLCAFLLVFFPQLWWLEPIPVGLKSSNVWTIKFFVLDQSTAAAFVLGLGAFVGMLLVGFVIQYWRTRFCINFVVYGGLVSLFLYCLGGTSHDMDGNELPRIVGIILVTLIPVFPISVIFAWKEFCIKANFSLGLILSFISKAIIVASGLFIGFFMLMSLLGIILSEGGTIKDYFVIAVGGLLLYALKESFISLIFDFSFSETDYTSHTE